MKSLFFAFLMAFTASFLSAQSTFGVVLGNVTDPNAAAVAGAKVKLTNTGESTSRETTGNALGAYEFQNVKPGTYMIEVSNSGFRTFVVKDLVLVARQTLRVDAALQLGEVSQTIEVTSTAGVIATDTPATPRVSLPKRSPLSPQTSALPPTPPPTTSSRLCPACRPTMAVD